MPEHRDEVRKLLDEALARMQSAGTPQGHSASGYDMQVGGVFWRLAQAIRILAENEDGLGSAGIEMSAVTSGMGDIRRAVNALTARGTREIHQRLRPN